MSKIKSKTSRTGLGLTLAVFVILIGCDDVCFAQENKVEKPQATGIELLTMNGGKPNLTSDGEGITSFKTAALYKDGQTRIKPFDLNFKIELPTGYTLFNNLAYVVDSEAVFSGPNDVVFRIPSAATNESFQKLRILFAERDKADPEKMRWIDATLTSQAELGKRQLSKAEFEERLPDFETRTLHALMEGAPRVLVVAIKDSTMSRDRFIADLRVAATVTPESVMEGREITYSFEITNDGPDTATAISFRSYVDPKFVSLNPSQGKCRFDAQNIYCNLGDLQKGATATVAYRGSCSWDFYHGDQPIQSEGLRAQPGASSAEGDPDYENNSILVNTPVKKDPNLPPVVAIVQPLDDEFLVGPDATVNIVATAVDKDGSVSKVEFFDYGAPIGTGKLTRENTYELSYPKLAFGDHSGDRQSGTPANE